jgi:hypothetical protein
VEAVARDVPFAPRAAPLAGAAPGAAPPATSPDVGATGPGPVAAGGREPERGPKSSLLPLDLGESTPRPPRAPDGGELATLVNDALVEQARRHGVDLS